MGREKYWNHLCLITALAEFHTNTNPYETYYDKLTDEIRQDIEDAVRRMSPWRSEDGGVFYGGWARMALPVVSFAVVEVAKPNIGEKSPSRVRADVSVNLSVRKEVRAEWENLRKHDVCFLVTVRPTRPIGNNSQNMNQRIIFRQIL